MSLLSFFRPRGSEPAATAPVARERLQILLSHERALASGGDDLISLLRDAVIKAIGKHVNIEPDKVEMKMNSGDAVSTLVIDIEIPRDEIRLAQAG